MLKIYYDRFTETCHNIFKSLIFFLSSFLFLFLVSIFSNIQKHGFFLETVIRAPFSRHVLTFRSSFAYLPLAFARRPHAVHTVRMPPASCLLILRTTSASCSRVLCTVRMPSASCLLVLRAPSASCPHVLCAPRAVHPPYVALFHKTKLKRVPSNWYNFLSLSQELFLLLCTFWLFPSSLILLGGWWVVFSFWNFFLSSVHVGHISHKQPSFFFYLLNDYIQHMSSSAG